eukprot:977534_1
MCPHHPNLHCVFPSTLNNRPDSINMADTITLHIIHENRPTFSVEVSPSKSILKLKQLISNNCDIRPHEFQLSIMNNKPLIRDHVTLIDYGINDGMSLCVTSAFRRNSALSLTTAKEKIEVEREDVIGQRYDVHSIGSWWPCTVIDVDKNKDGRRLKVEYDQYLWHHVKRYEWISLSQKDAIAHLGKYTSKPDIQRKLCNIRYLKALIGTKCDVYDTRVNQWVPCSVIHSNDKKIKVRYDGYSTKYDEWIRVDGDRYAAFNTHVRETQSDLIIESEKRKTEWGNAVNLFELIQLDSCSYYCVCHRLLNAYIANKKINAAMFDHNGNRCFCAKCHKERGDKETYSRGRPSQSYVLPVGYARFAIKLPSELQKKENILRDWHVVYHGTKSRFLPEICESGLILLKPNDFKLNDGDRCKTNKIRSGHIQKSFVRTNKHSNKKETFDPNQIFTSPSCIYSSYYCDKVQLNGHTVSFMFQCRQKPGTYSRGQETMRFGQKKIDQWVDNDSIEFYTKHNLNIIVTGILIKIHGDWKKQMKK